MLFRPRAVERWWSWEDGSLGSISPSGQGLPWRTLHQIYFWRAQYILSHPCKFLCSVSKEFGLMVTVWPATKVTWFPSFNTLQCNYNCTKERTNWQVITLLICQCFITLWKHDFLSNRMGGGQHICLRCGLIEEFWGIEMKYTGDGEISSPPHKYSFI